MQFVSDKDARGHASTICSIPTAESCSLLTAEACSLPPAETSRSIQQALDRSIGPLHLLQCCFPAQLRRYIVQHAPETGRTAWEGLLSKKQDKYCITEGKRIICAINLVAAVWRDSNNSWEVWLPCALHVALLLNQCIYPLRLPSSNIRHLW